MLSQNSAYILEVALSNKKVADEVNKRLVSSIPAVAADAQTLLNTLDLSYADKIQEYLIVATAKRSVGREIGQRLNKVPSVLAAIANGVSNPAVAASFTGQVAGMTTDITIEADAAGVDGNSVLLEFDGIDDIDTVIAAWNVANPSNTVTLSSGGGSQIPDNLESIALIDGSDASDSDLSAAKLDFGSEYLSDDAFNHMVVAMANRSAAIEFKNAYNAVVDLVKAL